MDILRLAAALLLGDPDQHDKVGHFLAYAALGFAGLLAWPGRLGAVLFLAVVYGGLMEIGQLFSLGRSATFADLLADALGAAAGAGFLLLLKSSFAKVLPWLGH